MTQDVRDWLPIEAAGREAVRAQIGRAVVEWSTLWFRHAPVRVSAYKPTGGEVWGDSDGAGWRVYRQAAAVSCSRWSMTRLTDWALDAKVEEAALTGADRQVIEAFEKSMIGDLVAKVELALGLTASDAAEPRAVKDPFGGRGGVMIDLADTQGGRLMALAIPMHAILPLCRSFIVPSVGAAPALDSLVRALGPATLAIEATLGRVEIPLADVQALGLGDVLILDAALDDAAELCLFGSDQVFARAKLTNLDGQMALTLQAG